MRGKECLPAHVPYTEAWALVMTFAHRCNEPDRMML